MDVRIEVKGLKELRRLLGPNLYSKPWADGMNDLARAGAVAARGGAPVRTGRLLLSIKPAVSRAPFPTWAAVRVRAKSPRGFPYPRILAFSPKHGHKDWLIRAVGPVWTEATETLRKIGEAIVRIWIKES